MRVMQSKREGTNYFKGLRGYVGVEMPVSSLSRIDVL